MNPKKTKIKAVEAWAQYNSHGFLMYLIWDKTVYLKPHIDWTRVLITPLTSAGKAKRKAKV